MYSSVFTVFTLHPLEYKPHILSLYYMNDTEPSGVRAFVYVCCACTRARQVRMHIRCASEPQLQPKPRLPLTFAAHIAHISRKARTLGGPAAFMHVASTLVRLRIRLEWREWRVLWPQPLVFVCGGWLWPHNFRNQQHTSNVVCVCVVVVVVTALSLSRPSSTIKSHPCAAFRSGVLARSCWW